MESLDYDLIEESKQEQVELKQDVQEQDDQEQDDLNQKMINYTEFEEELKTKYYKSNPLKNYAPTRGQPIMPERSDAKKKLPKIYNELRTTKNVEQDRTTHREKLRSMLKLNLKFIDPKSNKNPIDQLENSKKVYSEYCKYNLTKPIDLSNVESILKQNLKISTTTSNSSKMKDSFDYSDSEETFNISSNYEKPNHLSKSADLLIDAQTVEIKHLEDMSQEIKNRKAKLAKMDHNTENMKNFKHYYRMIKSGSNLVNLPPQHKGSIYNYRQAVKALSSQTRIGSAPPYTPSGLSTNRYEDISDARKSLSKLNSNSVVENTESNGADNQTLSREYERLKRVIYSAAISSEEKHQQRIKLARDKILYEQVEKHNLNKMTILTPFEDTKILINIDQVPSRFLNSLLNKQQSAPRYYIPPMRAFGYFKKVVQEPSTVSKPTTSMSSIQSKSRKGSNSRNRKNSTTNDSQLKHHNFNLDSLKSLNQSYIVKKEPSFTNINNSKNNVQTNTHKNKNNTNVSSSDNLKVDVVKKDISVK